MSNYIKHSGIIESIEGTHVRVRITQSSSCTSCKVASHCNASESKEKIIDVYDGTHEFTIGQAVIVNTSVNSAKLALTIGFIVPLLLLITIILSLKFLGIDDGIAAIGAIAYLVPYYIIIYIGRKKIDKRISFFITTDTD